MATATTSTDQIGETAGLVWHALDELGPQSLAKLPKMVDAPRDAVLMAVGWLAREDKIHIEEGRRTKIVSLVDNG